MRLKWKKSQIFPREYMIRYWKKKVLITEYINIGCLTDLSILCKKRTYVHKTIDKRTCVWYTETTVKGGYKMRNQISMWKFLKIYMVYWNKERYFYRIKEGDPPKEVGDGEIFRALTNSGRVITYNTKRIKRNVSIRIDVDDLIYICSFTDTKKAAPQRTGNPPGCLRKTSIKRHSNA